ncbi:hypothetical protein FQR65_LT20205 [Abscondita terminalis]|nr:hypothetical protein FQR65_LT20205 [Abscondita terminalis]
MRSESDLRSADHNLTVQVNGTNQRWPDRINAVKRLILNGEGGAAPARSTRYACPKLTEPWSSRPMTRTGCRQVQCVDHVIDACGNPIAYIGPSSRMAHGPAVPLVSNNTTEPARSAPIARMQADLGVIDAAARWHAAMRKAGKPPAAAATGRMKTTSTASTSTLFPAFGAPRDGRKPFSKQVTASKRRCQSRNRRCCPTLMAKRIVHAFCSRAFADGGPIASRYLGRAYTKTNGGRLTQAG